VSIKLKLAHCTLQSRPDTQPIRLSSGSAHTFEIPGVWSVASVSSFRRSHRVGSMPQTRSTSDRVGLRALDLSHERVGSYPQTRHDPRDPISGLNIPSRNSFSQYSRKNTPDLAEFFTLRNWRNFACSTRTSGGMDKWRLWLDSTHQIGLETIFHGVLTVGGDGF
jgi:hypothetical protein